VQKREEFCDPRRASFHGLAGTPVAQKRHHALAIFNEPEDGGKPMAPGPNQSIEEVLQRVQGEFLEMPGLRLTEPQARRLWGLDSVSCEALLDALVDAKFLFRTREGAFMRFDRVSPVKATVRPRPGVAA
jgi:hypothetical protein